MIIIYLNKLDFKLIVTEQIWSREKLILQLLLTVVPTVRGGFSDWLTSYEGEAAKILGGVRAIFNTIEFEILLSGWLGYLKLDF